MAAVALYPVGACPAASAVDYMDCYLSLSLLCNVECVMCIFYCVMCIV